MSSSTNRNSLLIVVAVACLVPSIYISLTLNNTVVKHGLINRAVIGILAFITSVIFIPKIAVYTEKKGLYGKDLGKRFIPHLRDVKVPEALGIVSAITYLVCIILEQVMFAENFEDKANYNSALTSVCFMVLLGFMDDVLDLPWRAKLFLPTIASFPLLSTYTGSTSIVVNKLT
jgi:UDP-N-acetylglucosamine--dolichyl-phosphate N-acetylglucosaminephosphotransferase